jgi:hypothetical protein
MIPHWKLARTAATICGRGPRFSGAHYQQRRLLRRGTDKATAHQPAAPVALAWRAPPRAVKHNEASAGAVDFVVDDGEVCGLWQFAGHQFQVITGLLAGLRSTAGGRNNRVALRRARSVQVMFCVPFERRDRHWREP